MCVSRVVVHLFGFLRIGTRHAVQTHELAGERVEIPVVQCDGEEECIERVFGEIVDVFDLADEPSVFAVQLETGERLALSVKHIA